jgi:hypothetical protein
MVRACTYSTLPLMPPPLILQPLILQPLILQPLLPPPGVSRERELVRGAAD